MIPRAKLRSRPGLPRLAPLLGLLFGLTGCRSIDPASRPWVEGARQAPAEVHFIQLRGDPSLGTPPSPGGAIAAVAAHWIQPGWRDRLRLRALLDQAPQETLEQPWEALLRRYRLWISLSQLTGAEVVQRVQAGQPVVLALPPATGQPLPRCAIAQGYDARRQVVGLRTGPADLVELTRSELDALRQGAASLSAVLAPLDFTGWALNPTEFRARALALERLGETIRAESDYRQLLLLEPDSSFPAWKMGNLRRLAGEALEAEAWYRKAMALDDSDPVPYNNLAFLLAERGQRLDEALRLARQAVYLMPSNARHLDTLGFVLYRKGAYDEAADVLERARGRARSLPREEQAQIAIHLALAQLGARQTHLVHQVVSHVVRLHPRLVLPPELQPFHPHDQPVRR